MSACVMPAPTAAATAAAAEPHMSGLDDTCDRCSSDDAFTLTLRCVNAPALAVRTRPSATVEQLLLQVAQTHGYAPDQAMLMKGGQVLRAESRLLDCPALLESKEAYLLRTQRWTQQTMARKQLKTRETPINCKGKTVPQQTQAFVTQKAAHATSLLGALPTMQQQVAPRKKKAFVKADGAVGSLGATIQHQVVPASQQWNVASSKKQKKTESTAVATAVVEATFESKFDDVDSALLQDELCDRTVEVVRAALRRVITLPVRGDWPVKWVVAKLARTENARASRIHLLCQNNVLQHEKPLHEYDELIAVAGRIHMLVSDSWLPPVVVQAKICPQQMQQHQAVPAKRAKKSKKH